MADFVIDDTNFNDPARPDGMKGCIPRDFSVQPRKMQAVNFPLIPESEYSPRIKEMEATKSRLSDIRMAGDNGSMIRSYDQNGQGFCWAYSTTAAVTLLRAKANAPHVRLSAHAVACKIKGFQDEGGWGAQSMEFVGVHGVPSEAAWPAKSMDPRLDNPATWADAARHKISEGWADLDSQVWDRQMAFDQVATLLLSRVPVVGDFHFWSHSVCLMDLVDLSGSQLRDDSGKLAGLPAMLAAFEVTGGFGPRLWNSWSDAWGSNGTAVLSGSKAIPDAAVAPLVTDA